VTAHDIIGIGRKMLAQAERDRRGIDVMPVLNLGITDVQDLEMRTAVRNTGSSMPASGTWKFGVPIGMPAIGTTSSCRSE
jgi:hypothetical protein